MVFYSEQLTPHHFTNEQNGYMYYAICELAKRNISKIDAYNITNVLNANPVTRDKAASLLTIPAINDFIENASNIARNSVEEYKMVANSVLNAAFRRDTYNKLVECQHLCFNSNETEIEQKIYSALDDVMMEFSTTTDVPQYKDVVDGLWEEIKARQDNGMAGVPFKFETLNQYATIEPGELFIFAAEAKQGKSMILLNEAVDLLKRNLSVMYIDSELNSRMFTCRMLSHLSGIEFNRLKSGRYSEEEGERIQESLNWLKKKKFTHLYMPMFDGQSIYTAVKKVKHTQGIDVLIVDYFKSKSDGDAFASYQELGRLVDMVKNQICGDMNIAGIGAAQATSTGKVADSAKIGRNASTIAIIQDKLPEEIEVDGAECGNKKLRIVLNRNGAQMSSDEYIDLEFNGNLISYKEAKQHIIQTPY
jgi:replicative DNA helicase